MTLFYLLTTIILGLSLILLIRPLLNPQQQNNTYNRNQQNIHYAKERLSELESQLKNASISSTEYEALKIEIENTLALDLDNLDLNNSNLNNSEHRHNTSQSNKGIIIALLITLPLSSFLLYQKLGTPEAITSTIENKQRPSQEEVQAMLVQIEQRLEQTPDDAQGWQILANVYLSTQQFNKAIKANQQLLRLNGEQAPIHTNLAEAYYAQGQLTKAQEHINKALSLNPNHPKSRWVAGFIALQLNHPELARKHWQTLLPMLPANSPDRQQLQKMLAELNSKPSANQQGTALITLSISLAEELKQHVKDNNSVFIIARNAEQQAGPPLAVKRIKVGDLPTTITLSDADAMAQTRLSDAHSLSIKARISQTGQAIAQTGDIESQAIEIQNSKELKKEITIILNQTVK